jgi:uncharacterized surface protein with fasciclin (FAS1) repeats
VQAILGDKAKLVAVLQYHVVPGATIGASRVRQLISAAKGGVLPFKTLQGDRVNATLNANAILINGAPARRSRCARAHAHARSRSGAHATRG